MIFLTILLKILAIIGIVLLSILALVFVVLMLVLFVPIRYRAKGSFHDKKPAFKAGVSWFLGIISLSFELGREKPLIIRIFGFRLKGKSGEATDEKKDEKTSQTHNYDSQALEEPADIEKNNAPMETHVDESTEKIEFKHELEDEEDNNSQNKNEENVDSSTQKPNLYDKLKRYVEIIRSDTFKSAFYKAKGSLGKIFKHILPRKWGLSGSVSLSDPATTAKIFEIICLLYPWTYKNIHISTDFSGEHIDLDGYAKGHITIFRILWLLACVYFNKNVKKLIKLFKEG